MNRCCTPSRPPFQRHVIQNYQLARRHAIRQIQTHPIDRAIPSALALRAQIDRVFVKYDDGPAGFSEEMLSTAADGEYNESKAAGAS